MFLIRENLLPTLPHTAYQLFAFVCPRLPAMSTNTSTPRNNDHEIEPLQLWIKNRCIWSEAHQKTLFFGLLVIVALATFGAALLEHFSFLSFLILFHTLWAAVTGVIAANKNRNIWLWGLLAGGWLGIIILLLLPPVCGNCLARYSAPDSLAGACSRCGSPRIPRYPK